MRLLVVEDEHSLREDIARKLRLSGYEVDACADGEAALEALAAERYDLVLLDLNLPKVDGMQVLRSLRRHDLETCVLILSARSEISDKVEGLDAGANDYLSKPFHLAELEARVRSLTRRKFIQQDVDYIVLAPVTETGWDTVLKEAKDADIPVIIVDRMIDVSDDSLYTAWVGSNFKMEGQKACEWLNAYAEAKGMKEVNIAHIQGTIGASAQIGRTEGLEEAAKEYGWNIVAQQTGEFTQAKGQEVMESMLKQHDNINVVYCENDNEAFGAIDAIEAAGKTVGPDGDILVMSFDTTNAGLTDTLSGKIICDTECNPLHGPRVEEIIKKLEDGKDVDKKAYVEEEMFAYDDTVKSVKVDDKDYDVTKITQEILDKRAY